MMFITHDQAGKVTGYSDGRRNPRDLKEGETQVEVALDWGHVDCKGAGLTFVDGVLFNDGIELAKAIRPIPNEGEDEEYEGEDEEIEETLAPNQLE